jgi:16S rRNA (guanine1207-N2)-methyltransferase
MPTEHYFTTTPSGDVKYRHIHAQLADHSYELTTANGVFSPDHIDTGTQVLLSRVPQPPPSGNILDIGCGWGPIALTMALESPRATVWAVDSNERALELTRMNAKKIGVTNVHAVLPSEIPPDMSFRTIWSNPPIRIGKNELHTLLLTWLPRLQPQSDAWLVIQRNLGADSLTRWLDHTLPTNFTVQRTATSKGYRVLRTQRNNT